MTLDGSFLAMYTTSYSQESHTKTHKQGKGLPTIFNHKSDQYKLYWRFMLKIQMHYVAYSRIDVYSDDFIRRNLAYRFSGK